MNGSCESPGKGASDHYIQIVDAPPESYRLGEGKCDINAADASHRWLFKLLKQLCYVVLFTMNASISTGRRSE
jgi:hypothetical protein